MDRSEWATAADLATAALELDPLNPDAGGLLQVARYRTRRRETNQGAYGRRRLTVLFCDLLGSTELASALDPEITRDVLRAYQQTCTAVVRAFGGFVARFIGDGLLAYFGFPRAHEDDAVRAIMAGRSIISDVGKLPVPEVFGQPVTLRVRIGIHTGLTVLAEMGSGERIEPFDVVGETPNLAARIQELTRANTVAVSDETYSMVKSRFDARPLGAHDVKGISRPVNIFEISGERHLASRFDAQYGRLSPLVGRTSEQASIRTAWSASSTGLQTILLCGDPGIGKSRLAEFAKELAATDQARLVVLQCLALHTSSAFHPFARFIRRSSSPDLRADMAALSDWAKREGLGDHDAPFLLASLLAVPPNPDSERPVVAPAHLRERTFELLMAWVDRMGRDTPVLLVVEDLQWADASTIELVRRITGKNQSTKMLLLLTSRTEPEPAVGATLRLGPLTSSECRQIVEDVRGTRDLTAEARREIVERCDGVPLFVEELTRMLIGNERPPDVAGRPSMVIPNTLNEMLVARLDQFPAQMGLLQAIATVAQPVTAAALSDVLDAEEAEIGVDLDRLLAAGVLGQSGTGDAALYSFAHVLLRDAAYDLQLLSRRRELHARIAAVLQKRFASIEIDQPNVLAYHFERSGQWEAAVDHWFRSGQLQASKAAHQEAIEDFRRALALANQHSESVGRGPEVDATLGLASSLLATRGYASSDVAEVYGRLRDLSKTAGEQRHSIPSLFGLWAYYHVRGDNRMSLELAEQLVAAAASSGTACDVVAADAVLGYQYLWIGDVGRARPLLEAASRGAVVGPCPLPHDASVGAAVNLAFPLWIQGHVDEARKSVAAASRRAEEMDGPQAEFTRAYTYAWAAEFFNLTEQYDLAADYASRGVAVSSEYGFSTWLGAGMLQLSIARANTELIDEPVATLRMILQAWEQAGARSNRSQFLLGLARALRMRGRVDEARAAIDDAIANVEPSNERFLEAELHRARGELMANEGGDPVAGQADLVLAAAIARVQGARLFELRALTTLVEMGAGSPEQAARRDALQDALQDGGEE